MYIYDPNYCKYASLNINFDCDILRFEFHLAFVCQFAMIQQYREIKRKKHDF